MKERILVVDDEEMICYVLRQRLTMEGYTCIQAHNGREALHHFYRDKFSLIISDVKMPEMDGLELLRRVKALKPSMIVIMITAYAEIDMAVEAIRLGAYDFILKPADLDWVVLSVQRALEKKRLEEEVEAYQKNLEKLVEERTAELQKAYHTLQKAHLDSVKALAEAIEAKDPYTRGHSDRVRKMSLRLGQKLDFSAKKLENLEFGALLHDIGKIGIKDEVLQKQSLLGAEEYHYIQEHPLIGVKIVEGVDFFKDIIPMIRHHHENFGGQGYPDGLMGEAIPLEARIITVSDAFDAMISARPHRSRMSLEEALRELKMGDKKQFDPYLLNIFLQEEVYSL